MKPRIPVALRKLREEIESGQCDLPCAVSRLIEFAEKQAGEIGRLRRKNLNALERASRAIARADRNAENAAQWWAERFAALRKETKP